MKELTHNAKIAVLRILNDIVNADNIVKDVEIEYMDEIAVLDTEKEVHALRQKGIEVIGIFTGGSREMETAQRIFGRDWIKIQDMNQFSEAVGKILRQKLYERGGV